MGKGSSNGGKGIVMGKGYSNGGKGIVMGGRV